MSLNCLFNKHHNNSQSTSQANKNILNQSKNFKQKINRINQLIIIGNGYDLHLHEIDHSKSRFTSRFIDFIKSTYSYFVKYINNIFEDRKITNNQKKYVVLVKILDFIFNNTTYFDNINLTDFSNNLNKVNDKLDSFNFWIIYLLVIRHLSNYKSPCWYNIENYLTVFLSKNIKFSDDIHRMNIYNIYNVMMDIIQDGIYRTKKSFNSLDKIHFPFDSNDFNLYELILVYFIILDDDYLRRVLPDNYFRRDNKKSFNKHISEISLYMSIHDRLTINDYEKENPETSFKNKMYFYLQSEMYDFEMSFNDYLVDQLNNNKNYYRMSYKFIFNMANDLVHPYRDSLNGGPFFSFLNFNYTNPLNFTKDMKLHFVNSQYIRRNIHGLLTNKYINYIKSSSSNKLNGKDYQIINKCKADYMLKNSFNYTLFHLWCYKHCKNTPVIGIDGTNIDARSPQYVFTKTYGIMRRVKSYNERGLLAPNVKYIKFFGHSLGKADYSYFESIFDKYHIYDNNSIMLVFYYNCYIDSLTHKPISDSKASLNQLHSISKLFEAYCDRKSYRINANELLSSLILNGRLIIRNINSIKQIDK